jgi:hypothetical protein
MELFGTVAGGGAYRALASEITDAGELVLRCPMPFVQRAEISLEGAGESPPVSVGRQEKRGPLRRLLRPREGKKSNLVEPIVAPPEGLAVEGYALVGPYRWDQRSLYFHASWRQTPSLRGVRATTWESGASSGRGVFVGSTLVASSPNSDWWGQGAERWVVDSSGPEVLLGTSVVDHFGVTEQPVEPARGGLRGMARGGGPGSFGHTALFRWRTLDAIPFASGCRFDWHFDPATHLLPLPAGAVCYWYADAWSAVSIPRLSREQVSWPTLPERRVPRIARAIEGEDLEVVHFDGEEPRTSSRIHDEAVGPWSGDADLNWRGLTPGRELVLSFEAPTPGRYRIKGYFSQGVDFGIHRLWVNDRPAGDPMDFFRAELGRTPAVDLGEFDLGAKGNRLSVRVISTSKIASPKSCRFGLDALVLTPVHAGDLSQLGAEPDHRE